jgi:hypothetical protein
MNTRTTTTTTTMTTATRALLALTLLLVGLVASSAPAGAQGVEFAVQPSSPSGPGGRDFFVYTLSPGQTFGDTVAISNFEDVPVTFLVYPTDAFNTEGDAAFALLREDEQPVDVGSWITLAANQYTVEARSTANVPFSITVPPDAAPGDHAGAIVAQPVPVPGQTPEGFTFEVRQRIGARVYARVDGPLDPRLRVDRLLFDYERPVNPFAGGDALVSYQVSNTGNVRLAADAVLRIKGPFGITLKELPARELPELLPGGDVLVTETVTGIPQLVRLTAEVEVTARIEDEQVVASRSVWAVPWLLLLVVLVVVGLAVVWLRRRRRGGGEVTPPAAEAPRPKVPA